MRRCCSAMSSSVTMMSGAPVFCRVGGADIKESIQLLVGAGGFRRRMMSKLRVSMKLLGLPACGCTTHPSNKHTHQRTLHKKHWNLDLRQVILGWLQGSVRLLVACLAVAGAIGAVCAVIKPLQPQACVLHHLHVNKGTGAACAKTCQLVGWHAPQAVTSGTLSVFTVCKPGCSGRELRLGQHIWAS